MLLRSNRPGLHDSEGTGGVACIPPWCVPWVFTRVRGLSRTCISSLSRIAKGHLSLLLISSALTLATLRRNRLLMTPSTLVGLSLLVTFFVIICLHTNVICAFSQSKMKVQRQSFPCIPHWRSRSASRDWQRLDIWQDQHQPYGCTVTGFCVETFAESQEPTPSGTELVTYRSWYDTVLYISYNIWYYHNMIYYVIYSTYLLLNILYISIYVPNYVCVI